MNRRLRNNHVFILVLSVIFTLFVSNNTVLGNQQLNIPNNGLLAVHFLDVGQADSVLVQLPNNEIMLIDAGNNADSEFIVGYLNGLGIAKIDYLIGTHPHEDHIGALDDVILNFNIGTIFMPRATTTTKTFEDALLAIESKDLSINTAKAGIEILNDSSLSASFVAPSNDSYLDLNNYSAVVKLVYGKTSFLFAGDAEEISENEMLANGCDLQADVLKVGHHGSNNSSSLEFLTAVSPRYAIISCGLNNDYGHPSDNVLQRLNQHGITIYRTDLQGTIIATSDSINIAVYSNDTSEHTSSVGQSAAAPDIVATSESPAIVPQVDNISATVYITKTGEKYHIESCSYLSKSKIAIDLGKAKDQGYTPCSRCNPPK